MTSISDNGSNGEITPDQIFEALKQCYDPEVPVNIVDLGLVYDVQIQEGNQIQVKMTLTTRGCSMGDSIANDARSKILAVAGVRDAKVEVVWEPPWGQHMISEEGRRRLGMV
jgi:metal-sulfur cluster biosynthetic enzyme